MRNLFFVITFLLLCGSVNAQSPTPNIDFELGNTSIWHFSIGGCCPINASATVFIPPMPNRHTLTSGPGVDPYGLFPVVAPDGGSYSLKLGNDSASANSERARYHVHVPPGMVDFSLIYRYAVVFQDPGHAASVQPRFEVRAYDSFTTGPLPCFQFTYVAAYGLPGFYNSTIDTFIRCRSWATGSINLSGFAGKTVFIDFATGDCGLSAHFGYAYIDMSYGLFAVKTVVCDADSITLTAPPGFHVYKWYDSTTGVLVDTTQIIRVAKPATPMVYRIVLLPHPGYGCPDTLYTTVLPHPLLFHAGADTLVCPGGNANLYTIPDDTGAISYSWSPADGVSCPTCPTTTATPAVSTQYIVTGTNSLGCDKKDTIEVTVPMTKGPPPGDTLICMGDKAALTTNATSPFPPLTFAWSPPAEVDCSACLSPYASPTVTTAFSVIITDGMGCRLYDTINVTVGGMLLQPENEIICNGVSTMLSVATIPDAEPLTYSWLAADGSLSCTGCTNPYAAPAATTVYTVTVSDTNGCSRQATLSVIIDTLDLGVMPDTTLCAGFPVILHAYAESKAGMTISYAWTPVSGLACANCTAPEAIPPGTTVYTVTVTDNACTRYDSVTVTIDPCDIHLPTAFTPNSDGMNDIFRVIGRLSYFRDFTFSIYNRWGERVFYTEDIEAGWDGTYKGITADLGTYFYMATYTLYGKKHMMKGDFHLVR